MTELPVKGVLRYPNGDRDTFNGVYENGILYRIVGITFLGLHKKVEAYEVDFSDIGVQPSGLGKFLGLPLKERVVDIDYNAHSSMSLLSLIRKPIYEEKETELGEKVKELIISGRVLVTRCRPFMDSKKKDFYYGITMKNIIEAEQKKFSLGDALAGAGVAIMLFKMLQGILASQGIII